MYSVQRYDRQQTPKETQVESQDDGQSRDLLREQEEMSHVRRCVNIALIGQIDQIDQIDHTDLDPNLPL